MQRHFRLRRNEDFVRLRQEGRAFSHSSMVLNWMPNGLPHNRYGLITSKKLGSAVARNRVRRRLREVVRLLHPRLRAGFDIVVIARPGLVGKPFVAMQRILEELSQRAGLLMEGEAK